MAVALVGYNSYAQTFNPTWEIDAAGSVNSLVGGYTFAYATSGSPWNGAFMSFGGFNNSYDCQLSTDYGPNGGSHLSFRTRNGDAGTWNSWREVWHSGNLNNSSTDFTAKNIYANGNVGIGTISPNALLDVLGGNIAVSNSLSVGGSDGNGLKLFANLGNPPYRTVDIVPFVPASAPGVDHVGLKIYTTNGGTTRVNAMTITDAGNVGVATTNTKGYTFAVNGSAIATSMTVKLYADWPDYVLKSKYRLPSLTTVKAYIDRNQHLPDMPSEKEVKSNGINLGEIVKVQTKKIEELTLYAIEQQKQIEQLRIDEETRIAALEAALTKLTPNTSK